MIDQDPDGVAMPEESVTVVTENPEVGERDNETDTTLELEELSRKRQVPDSEEKSNLVQRFLNLFKQQPDASDPVPRIEEEVISGEEEAEPQSYD